ncbi:MAG TPA: flagellar biosynthesis protein FlhB [Symbiobacteriaceae bacterium]|nr:flagellar biosynthesis protein FlhB [Symbiobacteriaceae bacterium]
MDLQLFAQEKTEEATPKRREDARKKGQVFKSTEVVAAATLLATYLVIKYAAPFMAGRVFAFSRSLWEQGPVQDWSEAGVLALITQTALLVAMVIAPVVLTAAAAGVAGNIAQVGFLFTLEPLTPSLDRINPGSGMKRLFSRRALVELLKSLIKISVIGYVAYRTVSDKLDAFPLLISLELPQMLLFISDLVSQLLLWVGVTTLVLSLADYMYQRYEYEESLKMSKQEIKEEWKQQEGNPEVRSKIKQKQREMARRRMMQDVRNADVVVTNPTHFAVALSYKQPAMGAPKVLAKGQGFVALRIRELAKEADVAIVENPPLARALYAQADVGQEIPADLYQAVAEVLAFVYQLKQKGY